MVDYDETIVKLKNGEDLDESELAALCYDEFGDLFGDRCIYGDVTDGMREMSTIIDVDGQLYKIDWLAGEKDTIDLMTSADYKERFKAEYYQTKIRYNSLHKMIVKYEADKLDFTPSCPLELLQEQASCMGNYLHKLEIRAEIENIEL